MTPHRNRAGAIAIMVAETLYLPTGRPVPADDVAGWEPSDDEPSAARLGDEL